VTTATSPGAATHSGGVRAVAVRALRKAGLLRSAERARFFWDVVRTHRANRSFARLHPDFSFPPYWVAYDAYRSCSYERYFVKGRLAADAIHSMYAPLLPTGGDDPLRVCEWGCGPGRILRHLPSSHGTRNVLRYGCDYNPQSIAWCQRAITQCTFSLNALNPPLPYADHTFDLLYSVSVYTHLAAETQQRWIAENLRVVKPGGFVMLTVHGDHFRPRLSPAERKQFDRDGVVERTDSIEGSRLFSTYNSTSYMRQVLLRDAELVHHHPAAPLPAGKQDVYVVRKPTR
jgi:SAM-dependent methyltransferase